MDINEFQERYSAFKSRDVISVQCSNDGCNNTEHLNKDSAVRNILAHGQFICRSCSYTEDGRKRIGKATSYKRSKSICEKMSQSKLKSYQTSAGQEHKKLLSHLAADGHAVHKFINATRQGWYDSQKVGKPVFYGSSYELRLCWELDRDDQVKTYETQVSYNTSHNSKRCLDFLITYRDGSKRAIEVKVNSRLNEQANIDQINDSRENAHRNGWSFEVYTEIHFGMSYAEIRNWADQFRSKFDNIDYVSHRKIKNCEKAKKHYHDKIATDTVAIFCDYCPEEHTALRLTYNKNVERNGRYICEREGGHIAGSKPKKKKINPYAAQGKKECTRCHQIKSFDEFGTDKSRADGHASRCKTCRNRL
jgi:hypothetical protein